MLLHILMTGQSCCGNHSHHLMLEFFSYSALTLLATSMSMKHCWRILSVDEYFYLSEIKLFSASPCRQCSEEIQKDSHLSKQQKKIPFVINFKTFFSLFVSKSIVTENMTRVCLLMNIKSPQHGWIMKHESRSRLFHLNSS